MPITESTIIVFAVALLGGCHKSDSGQSSNPPASGHVRLTSPAFTEGQPIPLKYSRFGQNVSPPLAWSGLPAGAKELALIVDDPDAPGGTFTHWLIYAIPATTLQLPEGIKKLQTLPDGMLQGKNGFGDYGYDGPQPPRGTHHYHFKIYALKEPLGLKAGATRDELIKAMNGRVLDSGQLVGIYTR